MFTVPRLPHASFVFCLFLAALGALSVSGKGAAPSTPAVPVSEEYVLRKWESEDGLPSNHVCALAQTPDGFLWVAMGSGGLARFDGVRFEPVLTAANPGLASDRVNVLYVARDGALWIGLERGGVARYKGGRFEMIVPLGEIKEFDYFTESFTEDAEGAVWFTQNLPKRPFRWKEGVVTGVTGGAGQEPFVHSDRAGKIWLQTRTYYYLYDGRKFRMLDPTFKGFCRMSPAKGGGMWVFREQSAEHTQLLYLEQADGSREFTADLGELGGVTVQAVNVLYTDHEGALWIGTRNNGLFRFEGGHLTRVPTGHSCILDLMEDREGNLWAGTEGGLNRLSPSCFSLYQTRHGLPHDSVVSIGKDSEGRLWLACRDGKVVRSLDPGNQIFTVPQGGDIAATMALCPEPTGGMWFGTLSDLSLWKNESDFQTGLISQGITSLFVDRKGDLWAGSIHRGLLHRHQGELEWIPTDNGLIQPRALAEDQSGAIWVGTEAGRVFRREFAAGQGTGNPSSQHFVPVPLPGLKNRGQVRFIVPDQKGSVWIGVFRDGLYRWKAGRVERLSPQAGLPTSDLRLLAIAPGGDFYFGTARGLHRISPQEIEAAMEGRPGPMRVITYGKNDGLPSMDFSFGFRNTSTQTPDGHLWFATYSGALEAQPERQHTPAAPLPVFIEKLLFGGTSVPIQSQKMSIKLPPHSGPFQIQYTLPQLSSPEQVGFRYRLIGSSDEWIPVEGSRVAFFERILPGTYRFEVEAADPSGPWGDPSVLEITVAAAWWETLTFKVAVAGLGATALAALVWFIVKRRMRARIRKLEEEHALERERIRIARDMHDELGATLSQISLSSELAQLMPPETASQQLKEIAALSQRTVASLDEIVWAVNPRNDNLPALMEHLGQYALDYLGAAGIHCAIEMPEVIPAIPIPSHLRHHLFLAVKEALNNVVKHAAAKSVRLRVQLEFRQIRIAVIDDGCGFDFGPKKNGADGLLNFQERMRELKGTCRIESSPGRGTSIIFELPLPEKGE